jgi:hypothetical protein
MEMQVRPNVFSTADEQALVPEKSFKDCARDRPEMNGSFTMGSPFTQRDRVANTGPQTGDDQQALRDLENSN